MFRQIFPGSPNAILRNAGRVLLDMDETWEAGMAATVADRIRTRIERSHHERILGGWGARNPRHSRAPATHDIVLTSNDYLALADDPRIAVAVCRAALDRPPATGHRAERASADLEAALATHVHAQSAVLCQSGWEANVGLLQSIADPATPVYLDSRTHMSLRFGARAAGAPVYSFRHNVLDDLRALITAHGPGVIGVDAIDSTGGSHAALAALCTLAEESGGVLIVDESHALGVTGPRGAGVVVALGLTDRVAYRTASLAKAFARHAGVVFARDPDFAEYFQLEAAAAVFSSPVPHADIAALTATLAVIQESDSRRDRLREVGHRIRTALRTTGFELAGAAGHLVSLPTGPAPHAIAVRDHLEKLGVFGSLFWPPATPDDATLIRFSLHAALTDSQVDRILDACREVANTYGPIPPAIA